MADPFPRRTLDDDCRRLRDASSDLLPRIGCGLAGGTWERVEELIALNLSLRGIPVTVYDLASED